MENKLVSRRRALHVIGMTTGGMVMVACSQEKKGVPAKKAMPAKKEAPKSMPAAPAGGDGCSDAVDDTSKKLRATLQYVEKSAAEGKMCSNCLQYNEPAGGKKCGGCKLFTGPVQPGGYCLSWAAKQA